VLTLAHRLIGGLRPIGELLRFERTARWFFAVFAQSALGTGAAYVGLLLVAYERFHSPWAISLVLMADLLPAMLLGPVFGAIADRWSRRLCLVVSDAIRAGAFLGIVLVSSFEATLALAAFAGVGTALFNPASLAALPSLTEKRRLPAATSLYGTLTDAGWTVGPALAAVVLALGGPDAILIANAITFLASAAVLSVLDFGGVPARESSPARGGRIALVLREAREGVRLTAGMPGVRVLLLASSAALFCAGLFNVGELIFATEELDVGNATYSAMVATFGAGFILGSLAGASGGTMRRLKRGYLSGLLFMSLGLLFSGLAPTAPAAFACFALAGLGNGMALVYERLLMQSSVRETVMARVFGIKDALTAWMFALAFVSAGAIVEVLGVRGTFLVAGALGIVAWSVSLIGLKSIWTTPEHPPAELQREGTAGLAGGAQLRGNASLRTRKDSADVVDGHERWLALLDDLG
jgi:MFS family permease